MLESTSATMAKAEPELDDYCEQKGGMETRWE